MCTLRRKTTAYTDRRSGITVAPMSDMPPCGLSLAYILTSSQLPQVINTPIEDIRVPTISIAIAILPNSLIRPPTRDRARRRRVAREHERVGADEGVAVARAALPPRRVGVQHRVPPRLAVVAVAEALDPGHHGRGAETPSRRPALALEVEHTGQSDAVPGPAAAVREEVVGLRGACGLARVGEVVAAADEAGVGGACVVRGEGGVGVGCSLRCLLGGRLVGIREGEQRVETDLDDHEAGSGGVGRGEVNAGLVVGDVEALDCCLGGGC